jgi:hypothetical protein
LRAHICAGSGRTPGATPKSNADNARGLDAGFTETRVFLCAYTSILRRSRAAGSATKLMTSDRARRIAANIAKLPDSSRLRPVKT